MKKNRTVFCALIISVLLNLILGCVKLYIATSSNSVSIYSDSINNYLDSISALISLISLYVILYEYDLGANKSEQLFSFLMALAVLFAGIYFAYNSLERLMYPVRIWFSYIYTLTLVGTAAVKILMFFIFRGMLRKSDSSVIAVMKTDCLLDFFITAFTILSFVASKYASFSFDAVFGLVISAIIIVSAVKMILSNGKQLVNYIPSKSKDELKELIGEYKDALSVSDISYYSSKDGSIAYVTALITDREAAKEFVRKAKEKLNMEIKLINTEF